MFRKILSLLTLMLSALPLMARDLNDDIDQATKIVKEFSEIPEQTIPPEIFCNAKGLAILTVIKGGFGVGARGGSGLVIAKLKKGWSAPSAIGMGGGSIGWQIGAEIQDLILVLNTQEAVEAFSKNGNFTLGADLSVAAGPVGRLAGGAVSPEAAIYTYSRAKGVFAGISLEGTIVATRKKANHRFYNKHYRPEQLLSGDVNPPVQAAALYDALNKYPNCK